MLKLFLVWRRHFQNGCLREWFSHFAAFQYHLVSFDYFCCWDCTPYQICHHLWEWETGTSPVQLLSCVWLFVTPWTVAHQASLSVTNSWSSSSRWCHPIISSSVVPFSCLQSFSALGSFLMSQPFTSGGQITGASASSSVLLVNIQDWFPLGLTGLIALQSKGLLRVFSIPHFKSINSLALSFLYSPTLTSIHDYWKNHRLD